MNSNKQLVKYKNNPIKKWFVNIFNKINIKSTSSKLLDKHTLDIRMLDKKYVNLFGKAKLERIITDKQLQEDIINLSDEELQVYDYILNYNL